ncbi:MAG TPA: single-stranded-DNA-specific exonuclease RecJ [Parvularculaceae bacterium]|nr:single-stranded-DNA-specific exonuclease RecJ [Parvularculaceae bacterium]
MTLPFSRRSTAGAAPLPLITAAASGRPWRLLPVDEEEAAAIAEAAKLPMPIARLLAARDVRAASASAYLEPSLRDELPDPFVLKDMDRATARLADAVMSGETVGVFGDYDVDGTTGAALLKLYFDAIGAPLCAYLPDRILEGYGPSIEAFRELARAGAKVIVTVDCGAAAHDVIEKAAAEGLDVIVFDHHLMAGAPPKGAVAVINPNQPGDISGLGGLSAVGVVFMALVALNRALRGAGRFTDRAEPDLKGYLDLVALGLVCDVMPISGLTRTFVAQGLKVLGRGNKGLAALGARAGLKGAPSAYHLGFLLGPRINAAGRIGHARLAFELLTSTDENRRVALADQLHLLNAERQAVEAAVLDEALRAAERQTREVVVVAGEGWHQGVIGIVAGRLKEKLDRPAIVIALDGETGKGSGRSIAGVDLGAAVIAAKQEGLLIAGGGHAMAAGLTIARGRIEGFSEFLNERLGRDVIVSRAARRVDIDAVVAASAVTKEFADLITRAGPFGAGNPEPVFVLTDMRAEFVRTVGDGHVSCTLVSRTGEQARAIAFRAAEMGLEPFLRAGEPLHIAGKIRPDDWRGGGAGQLHILDAAKAA